MFLRSSQMGFWGESARSLLWSDLFQSMVPTDGIPPDQSIRVRDPPIYAFLYSLAVPDRRLVSWPT